MKQELTKETTKNPLTMIIILSQNNNVRKRAVGKNAITITVLLLIDYNPHSEM